MTLVLKKKQWDEITVDEKISEIKWLISHYDDEEYDWLETEHDQHYYDLLIDLQELMEWK